MGTLRVVLWAVLTLGMPVQLSAQECSAVLGAVRDVSINQGARYSFASFKRFFCDQTFSSFQQARDVGITANIVIESLPVEFKGHDRNSEWSQYQHSVCESIDTFNSLNETWRNELSKANTDVVNAWSACVTSAGLHFWAEVNESNPEALTLAARYKSQGPPFSIRVSSTPLTFSTNGVSCPAKAFQKAMLSPGEKRVDCKRENADIATNITLHTQQNGDRTIRLMGESVPSSALPSISNGVFTPNAMIEVDTDHGPLRFSHTAPLSTFPIALTGPNLGHPPLGTFAEALYKVDILASAATSNHVSLTCDIRGTVGGVCGAGASGGKGGMSPEWVATLELPRQKGGGSWKVTVTSDIVHKTTNVRCLVAIDGQSRDLNASGNMTVEFMLDPGEHILRFSCAGTNPYIGCYGHAGGVNDPFEDLKYSITVDAKPVAPPRTPFM